MDLKKRIGDYIVQLMAQYQLTYRMLATVLGISPGRLSSYCNAKELPRADVLIKLADIGGITVDDLLRTNKPPVHKELIISASGLSSVTPANSYIYKNGDLTDTQAAIVQDMAEEIVELERETSGKPKSLAAVYNAVSKHFKVQYYRQIKETEFQKVESYLLRWKGKLKKAKASPDKDILIRRKKRCSDILSITKKELGWTRKGLDNYIYEIYGVNSITDLEDSQLEHLYSKVSAMKG
ncbi:helix-turn-helix domain-containing protein [Candidatus Magnetomonas plexicatena]|uniref:helix-turn-helix domain-containing protein n=1 Tax=Candidatus Magnetomonas plexicatena TaxID=2552947 RepID=UPI001C7573C3|nr:helix-turn-helix transcriptional regulator [Nitrospirales bacterium LBB_01]